MSTKIALTATCHLESDSEVREMVQSDDDDDLIRSPEPRQMAELCTPSKQTSRPTPTPKRDLNVKKRKSESNEMEEALTELIKETTRSRVELENRMKEAPSKSVEELFF
ncbi:uncharacterized protein LOC121388028 [Gigantopelta aegis]|uniref:uncharacterized protein LOC121388028 n=1 Tax=Gigantopelta aegis TaxID=1735272 RepID=UPI001B88CF41|nr:uncharacterized protein LOC121388028 [Gigantopelta aegis]